jgi:hypothetical protein
MTTLVIGSWLMMIGSWVTAVDWIMIGDETTAVSAIGSMFAIAFAPKNVAMALPATIIVFNPVSFQDGLR